MLRYARAALCLGALIQGAAPSTISSPPPPPPYLLVLGSAQDAGIPQVAAHLPEDEAARKDPSRRRLVSSLLIADPASGKRWLIDATPDFREQVARAEGNPPGSLQSSGRPPLFDAIFLTHAHMGHYSGLLQLGREAYAAEGQRVEASAGMSAFLEKNAPWELLVRLGHIRLETFAAGVEISLAPGLSITPIAVPHRAEYTDTYAFVIRGPHRSALYLPDIDRWDAWDQKLEDVLHRVDLAFLDGTFFDETELPGRKLEDIPHPLIRLTLERLAALPEAERRKVVFTHLNHSNTAADPRSPARARILAAGARVASEEQREDL